jgi:hypothetical protein
MEPCRTSTLHGLLIGVKFSVIDPPCVHGVPVLTQIYDPLQARNERIEELGLNGLPVARVMEQHYGRISLASSLRAFSVGWLAMSPSTWLGAP